MNEFNNVMSRPSQILVWMGVFIVLVLLGVIALAPALQAAYLANPWFNGLILGILIAGMVINFRQVLSLNPEINWIEAYRLDGEAAALSDEPELLAAMARMLTGKGEIRLSAMSMRTLLESIQTRFEEARDLSRYVIGVLIFLGLLGTFWGLMATVNSVGTVINGLQVPDGDGLAVFENLKQGLAEPLSGMGVAFSSSLFGLAGALLLGFLDLQAAHAQNRFLNELEHWLAGSTRLSSGLIGDDVDIGAPAYTQALLEQTADAIEKLQRSLAQIGQDRREFSQGSQAISETLTRLNDIARAQHEQLSHLSAQQNELAPALRQLSERLSGAGFSEELRNELRLLNRTIAKALAQRS